MVVIAIACRIRYEWGRSLDVIVIEAPGDFLLSTIVEGCYSLDN